MLEALLEALRTEFPTLDWISPPDAWRVHSKGSAYRVRGFAYARPGLLLQFDARLRQEGGLWRVERVDLVIRNRVWNS